jgi:hypothetical protein
MAEGITDDVIFAVVEPSLDEIAGFHRRILRQIASYEQVYRRFTIIPNARVAAPPFLWVGRTLEGLFHLAGLHELAERVRPSTRRPGRRAEEDPGPGSEESTPEDSTSEEPTSPSTGG